MQQKYLYQVLPFLKDINAKRREQIENYFTSAPVWLMDSFQIVEMDMGVTFVHENEIVDTIYIICKGLIKAIDYSVFGIAFDFMRFDGLYAMGGMEVVMDLDRYMTTLQTVTPCIIITIPKSKFEKWLKTDSKALKQEAKAVGEYLLEQGRTVRAFLFLKGSDRLCMLLMQRYENFAKKDEIFEISSTRQELSEESGLCVKTINRSIKKLEEQGLIGRKGNKITIDKTQFLKIKEVVLSIIDR